MHHNILMKKESSLQNLAESYRSYKEPETFSTYPDERKKSNYSSPLVSLLCFLTIIAISSLAFYIIWNEFNSSQIINPFMFINNLNSEDPSVAALPESYSIFKKDSEPPFERNNNAIEESWDIPVIFDLPGTESGFIGSILSECYGMKEISLNKRNFEKRKLTKPQSEFMITDSICDFAHKLNNNFAARLFLLIRNPAVRIIRSFDLKQNYSNIMFDERLPGITLDEYLNSTLFENNSLTRSILCKEYGELTENDFKAAKNFLKNQCTIGTLNNFITDFSKYEEKFIRKANSPQIQSCLAKELKQSINSMVIPRHESVSIVSKILLRHNEFDVRLYSMALTEALN